MIVRVGGTLALFGGAWWALVVVGGAWFRAELTGPVALVWWALLVILPLGVLAAMLVPDRPRRRGVVGPRIVVVHVHHHVHVEARPTVRGDLRRAPQVVEGTVVPTVDSAPHCLIKRSCKAGFTGLFRKV